MLSLDGIEHERHRGQFAAPFRPSSVRARFDAFVGEEVGRLIDGLALAPGAELRRSFAGPLAAATVAFALGMAREEVGQLLAWYDQIVAGVNAVTAGEHVPAAAREAFSALSARLRHEGFSTPEAVSNAAVLLFGGIETTEGMIANAVLALLQHRTELDRVREQPGLLDRAIDESLRLEPAAAVVDRYATEPAQLGGAEISAGELVRVSITAANRDPAVFPEPNRFDLERSNPRRHVAFAQGPHVCLGIHLARLEARHALSGLLARFPRLRLDPDHPAVVSGLVFRKPLELRVRWD
jgi:cytochrome P450